MAKSAPRGHSRRTCHCPTEVTCRLGLKWRYQPSHRGVSWRLSIRNARLDVAAITKDSPSLRPQIPALLADEYPGARSLALDETGLPPRALPADCPFECEQVLDADYWPA